MHASNNTRVYARHHLALILAPGILVIAILLPLLSATVATSAKQSHSRSNSSAASQENPIGLNRWSSNGPDGGQITSLAIDLSNPAIVYAGAGGGVFKSTNGGESWSPSLSPDYDHETYTLAIDPETPTTVYAGGNFGVSKSTDGGTSWNTINNGLANQYGNAFVSSLAIDPGTPTTLYAAGCNCGGDPGISKSTDAGAHWNTLNTGPFNQDQNGNGYVVNLAIDPSNPNIIYAAGGQRIVRSTDSGTSWGEIFDGSRVATFFTLKIDPINSNTIYAGGAAYDCCGGVVLKSTDNGGSWNRINLTFGVSALTIDPTNPNLIYGVGIISQFGVFKSTDGGQSWRAFNNGLANSIFSARALAIDPVNPTTVYVGTDSGVFKSTNSGVAWSAANNGLRGGLSIWALTLNPRNPSTIYTNTPGFQKSTDNGGSWAASNFYPLAFDPRNPNIIYSISVTGRYGLSRSTDGGATWTDSSLTSFFNGSRYISALVIDPSNSEVIYAALDGTDGGVFKSIDGGTSWIQSSTVRDGIYTLTIDPGNSNVIYAGGSTVFKSTDAGGSWSPIGNLLYVGLLVIDPNNSQTLYAQAYDDSREFYAVYKSTDGGENWNVLFADVSSLVIDPVHPSVIYVGTYGGVFRSADGGASWNPFNDGLLSLIINALAIDATGSFLHAATPAGVFDTQINCTYSTSSASQTFPAGGGVGNVSVTTSSTCDWQATSSVSWVTINSSSSGTADGTVTFSVAPNANPFPRTTTLNIAGQPFTVNQFCAPPTNSIDDTEFFVRRHYLDFLNREPDAQGFEFWTNDIIGCGFNTQCFELKRINVSAAFFISIEFQQTGYLVYRTYKASFGNLPNAPVPIRLSEFLPDTQAIGQGVIVNQAGWEQLLENNKQAFFSGFVQRERFTAAYLTSLTPAAFVDMLFANAGVTPSVTDRTAAIDEFSGAGMSADTAARARALRRVAENSTLAQQEFNRAFVLMQYFGYLRRNPNDPPELALDFQGYNFWLNKLNQFNGNFVNAEMVKAFITSGEYRQRFGP